MGWGFDATLLLPATQHPSTETGLPPGLSPKDQVRLGFSSLHLPSPDLSCLCCPAADQQLGNVLTEGDFGSGMSVRLRGPLNGVGHGSMLLGTLSCPHCHLASCSGMCSSPPSPLPRERCSLRTEVGSLAAPPLVQQGFRLCPPPPSPQSYWLSPSSLWSIHPAGTGPRDKGHLSPCLSLQADGRHQLPTTCLCDNLSHPLPFGDTPPHS